jgi:hypothetical protein
VTNVELVLYLALGLWALGPHRPPAWTPVHRAALLFAAAFLVSAAVALEHRADAVKFALRQAGGVALFFAAADIAAAVRPASILAGCYAAGSVVSALCAIAEVAWRPAAEALLRFKTHPSLVDGVVRASGTLQYANLAAMCWGMALPVTVALGASRPGIRFRVLAAAAALVLAQALVLSASRAGLVTALVVLAAMALAPSRRVDGLRGLALVSLAGLAGLAGLGFLTGGALSLRLREREDRPWFAAEFRPEGPRSLAAGAVATVPLRVRNVGRVRWAASGEHPMAVGYQWLTQPDGAVRQAAPLPRDLEPGESVTLDAGIVAPRTAGRHRLRWLLTGGGVAWVGPSVGASGDLDVEVGGTGVEQPAPEVPAAALPMQQQPTRPALWRAGLELFLERPFFGVGPDNFRRLYSRKLGPRALDERVHANSLYVEVLATLGLCGAASLTVLGGALARTGAQALTSPDSQGRLIAAGALGGLLAFLVHGMVDYGLEATAIYGSFWLLAGLLAGVAVASRGQAACVPAGA